MNGFDNETWGCVASGEPKCPKANPPYSYVPQKQTLPYFSMAKQYVLADEMYASDFDISSFISHQYIIAAVNPDPRRLSRWIVGLSGRPRRRD